MYIADGDYIKDIEVNDLRNRYTLTKGSTQKMVNILVMSTDSSRLLFFECGSKPCGFMFPTLYSCERMFEAYHGLI